jgi:L-alanine-DL-glutamate epimerase-like enolase superfamily enzyme
LILNESARDVEKLWRHMYIVEENTLGGPLFAAISAIDIALWDIIGKRLNVLLFPYLFAAREGFRLSRLLQTI